MPFCSAAVGSQKIQKKKLTSRTGNDIIILEYTQLALHKTKNRRKEW